MTTDPELLSIANDSGFPLQIALHHSVNESTATHGWRVRHTEHAWTNSADNQSGFIDLVLQDKNNYSNLVIECKRVRNATWLFFNSSGSANHRLHCKSWVTHYNGGKFSLFGWHEIPINPATPEAQYCTVRGQSTNDKNTFLERISGAVISSTEALALEEQGYRLQDKDSFQLYFNAIVTTARLKFAEFTTNSLSVTDGTLTDATFFDVPFVRVRKQFSMRPASLTHTDWLRHDDPDYRRENTVFVINADSLNDFLARFDIPTSSFRQLVG